MSRESSFSLPANGIVVALLAVSGAVYVAREAPLQGARPTQTEAQLHVNNGAGETIEARHGQDPLSAIANAAGHAGDAAWKKVADALLGDDGPKCLAQLPSVPTDKDSVIGVMLSGDGSFESSEGRKRARYAVLGGLGAEGYAKENTNRIGCWNFGWSGRKTLAIPFESFKRGADGKMLVLWLNEDALSPAPSLGPTEGVRQIAKSICPARFKIVGPSTSDTLVEMIDKPDPAQPVDVAADKGGAVQIWPISSSSHPSDDPICKDPPFANVSFYSYGATISDVALDGLRQKGSEKFGDATSFLKNHHVTLFRSIAHDGLLAEAIAAELKRRSVVDEGPKKRHIALIGEWDTNYGRYLPQTIAAALDPTFKRDAPSNWIDIRTYERGLDGAQPGAVANAQNSSNADKDAKASNNENKAKPDPEAFDRPYGLAQQDYLRRLAKSLKAQEEDRGEGGRLAAIGILGTDVFDKLLLLRALKPLFPDALFFTTDLDLTLTMPSERDWTRNLVVASSFGPELDPNLQGDIPAFRDSYETSAFLATRLAIAELKEKESDVQVYRARVSADLETWLRPRIFEIDRRGAVVAFQDGSEQRYRPNCAAKLLDCTAIHPRYTPVIPKGLPWLGLTFLALAGLALGGPAVNWPSSGETKRRSDNIVHEIVTAVLFFLLTTGVALLLVLNPIPSQTYGMILSVWIAVVFLGSVRLEHRQNPGLLNLTKGRDPKNRSVPATEFALGAIALLMFALASILSPVIADFLSASVDAEPFSILGGDSLWPSIVLRLLTLLLSIGLLMRGLRKLNENLIQLADDLGLGAPGGVLKNFKANHPHSVKTFLRSIPGMFMSNERFQSTAQQYDIEEKWSKLVIQGRWSARLVRVMAGVLIMLFAFRGLAGMFGNPNLPARNPDVRTLYSVLTTADVIAMLVLVFFVADATKSFWLFVRQIGPVQTNWPKKTKETYEKNFGAIATHRLFNYWIDLDFIARRTRCIGNILYYPFIVIALMIISRNPFFANFEMSPPILFTLGLCICILLFCAFALRRAAECARSEARKVISEAIVRAKAPPANVEKAAGAAQEPSAEQLEALLARVDDLQEGAFLPFSQQPPVRAIMLPFVSAGLTILTNWIPGI
jgi:hypothetical protein